MHAYTYIYRCNLGNIVRPAALMRRKGIAPAKASAIVRARHAHPRHPLEHSRHGQRLPEPLHGLKDDDGAVVYHGVWVREAHAHQVVHVAGGIACVSPAHRLVLALEGDKVGRVLQRRVLQG